MRKIFRNRQRLEKIAIFGDKVIAYLIASVKTPSNVRDEIMDPAAPVQFFERYKRNFTYHVKTQNNHRLQNWVIRRNGGATQTVDYDPTPEINAKGLQEFYDILQDDTLKDFADVRYFQKTEHQPSEPMRCTVGDYQIDFGPAGTKWCGGRGGNGYVFKRNAEGNYQQVAVISHELSKYFAEKAIERVKLQHARMR